MPDEREKRVVKIQNELSNKSCFSKFRKSQRTCEVIIIGNGTNYHEEFKFENLPKSFDHEEFKYKLSPSGLFVDGKKILFVFEEKNESPVTPGQGITKVTGSMLYIAESSTSLRTAISSLFREPSGISLGIGGKKLILIIIAIVVLSVIGLTVTRAWDITKIIKLG